jgi:hypothetical protein
MGTKLLMLLFFVTGCASTTKARLQNLPLMKPGITKADVIDRFGEPDEKIKRRDHEIWRYVVYSDDSSHSYPYRADIKNGILKSFDPDSGFIPRSKKYSRSAAVARRTTSTP